MNSANSVTDCVAGANGNGASTAGIHATGFGNRIEGNEVRDNNNRGIKLDVANAHNVVIRNTAGNNSGGNYDVGTGNGVGPIISADEGNVGTSTSPWANIQD